MLSIDRSVVYGRLELAEAVRSRWVVFTLVCYGVLFGLFFFLGLRESSILGFTGLSRVVLNVANAVVLGLPLITLVATSQAVVRARSSGLMELLFTQPSRRSEWFVALLGTRVLILMGPLAIMLMMSLGMAVMQGGEEGLAITAARSFAICAALCWAFVGMGLGISAMAPTAERAVVYGLMLWLLTAVLHDFALVGVLLQWRLPPGVVFTLAALNPVEAARIGILGSVDPELAVLGPVGFWLANHLGSTGSWAVALIWPGLLGTLGAMVGWRRVVRADAVG